MKKVIKYSVGFLVLLLALMFLLVVSVLYTEKGTQIAINQFIKYTELPVSYRSLKGNLANGLVINDFKYESYLLDIKSDKISYKSQWSNFFQHLELSGFVVDDLLISIPNHTEKTNQPTTFNGFTLPITTVINQLNINRLTVVVSKQQEVVDQLNLTAVLAPQGANIKSLLFKTNDYQITTSGELSYGKALSYNLLNNWQYHNDMHLISGQGTLNGSLNEMQFKQQIDWSDELLNSQFEVDAVVKSIMQIPSIDARISSPNSQIIKQQLNLKGLIAQFSGTIDNYQLVVDTALNNAQMPDSQLHMKLQGNLNQFTTKEAQIVTKEGLIDVQATLIWQNQIELQSQIEFNQFNPQQILKDWPGSINGHLNADIQINDKGELSIHSVENLINGQLKGQPFVINGALSYVKESLYTDHINLMLGDNIITVDGELSEQTVNLHTEFNLKYLGLFDEQLQGRATGYIELKGSHQKPFVDALIQAENLQYDDNQIASVEIKSKGEWGQHIETNLTAKDSHLKGQNISLVTINQMGWLNQHTVNIDLETNEFSSSAELKGGVNKTNRVSQPWVWQGQLTDHQITTAENQSIKLQAPIDMKVSENISIQTGCWTGGEAGTLCVNLNDIVGNQNTYEGALTVEAFSLLPLQVFLPEQLEVKGKLSGKAQFSYQPDNFNITSDLNLNEGILSVKNQGAIKYQTAINLLAINASTHNESVDLNIQTQLADKSHFTLQGQVEPTNYQPNAPKWQINAQIEGQFNDTALISSLSSEIKDMQGQLMVNGSIEGAIKQPKINLHISQPQGYVALTRLGTLIEQLEVNVLTQNTNKPMYHIDISGVNTKEINQGKIQSQGELSYQSNQWQYKGRIKGNNFMVLNLPEIKFNITPDLKIMANQSTTNISGDIVIDSGFVSVKQLPDSTISNSDDLEIHTNEAESNVLYPITLDIKASIKEQVDLDVIGLHAGLSGAVNLKQGKDQVLKGNGTLNLKKGSYEIYGQKLDIIDGELTFTGPIANPRLKMKASRTAGSGDVVAGVNIGGTVNNLHTELFSEPTMTDIEKLSYIITGRGIESSGSLSGEELKQAAIVMGLNQSNPIFKQIQNQFGIDVLTVKNSSKAADTVVEAGKKINDKLYVSYNQGLFSRVGFWVLKYRLNQFLNLQTAQGEDQSIELVYTRKAKTAQPQNKQD